MDLKINAVLLILALGIAFFVGRKQRSFFLGFSIFSILSNIIFYTDRYSPFYAIYNLKWIVIFTLDYWPWINVALFVLLVAQYLKNRSAQKNV